MRAGKTEAKAMAKLLESMEHEDVMEAAADVLDLAYDLYERKAKFMIMGQIKWSDGYIDPDDVRASRVILGPFSTRKQAEGAGESLAYSGKTGEEARWAAAPVWRGTPASWYQERKIARDRAAQDALGPEHSPREMRLRDVQEYRAAHPEGELPDHLQERGDGWEGLDRYMKWKEEHALACPSCEGTGQITPN